MTRGLLFVLSTTVSCKYANGDYCSIDKKNKTAGFRKTLADGVLSKDASSTLITYEGKDKSAATTMSGIDDVAAFMRCKTMDDAKELYIFYFDPLREALIKSLKKAIGFAGGFRPLTKSKSAVNFLGKKPSKITKNMV